MANTVKKIETRADYNYNDIRDLVFTRLHEQKYSQLSNDDKSNLLCFGYHFNILSNVPSLHKKILIYDARRPPREGKETYLLALFCNCYFLSKLSNI